MTIEHHLDERARPSEIVAGERSRLRNFIRKPVPDPSDVEGILQEVFYELMEANPGSLLKRRSAW